MNLYLRTFIVWLASYFRRRLGLLDTSVLKLAILPNDLDIYGHLNNGRYLTLMDLGRMDIILRSELMKLTRKKRWMPIVGAVAMEYYKSFQLFQTFELKTRMLCWDEKWFYLEQRFERGGRLHALGLVKGLFVGPKGRVPIEELIRNLQTVPIPPAVPEVIQKWQALAPLNR